MIRTVRAFILHRREVTESSLILTVFSDRSGKLALIAKGALREKSPFRGRLELFSLASITYYENRRRGLNILSDCAVIDPHAALRSSFHSFMAACFLAELVDMGTGIGAPSEGVYELLAESFSALPSFPDTEILKRRFELRLLSLLGYGLRLDSCLGCRRTDRPLHYFSDAAGGMLCNACSGRYRSVIGISAGTLAAFRYLAGNPIRATLRVKLDQTQASEAKEMLRRAILFYLERQPRTPFVAAQVGE